jgi:hypothetical protein
MSLDIMGLSFQVGSATQVILEPAASQFAERLASRYPGSHAGSDTREEWCSDELPWSGWQRLQERVSSTLGKDQAPHLLSMEAWFGGYLPMELEPDAIDWTMATRPSMWRHCRRSSESLKRSARARRSHWTMPDFENWPPNTTTTIAARKISTFRRTLSFSWERTRRASDASRSGLSSDRRRRSKGQKRSLGFVSACSFEVRAYGARS